MKVPILVDIEVYNGIWSDVQAAHLLRRTTYGVSPNRIQEIVDMGMDAAVDYLLRDLDLPSPPLNKFDDSDEFASIGETWVDKAFDRNGKREESFKAWMIDIMMNEGNHIREKLTIFWHNHFVVSNLQDARYVYSYSNTLRSFALGNFGDLVKAITIEPGMLRYLNGKDNKEQSPNENYARELLELFTVGKGSQVGQGDYTTFTEKDVTEIARILTGWRDRGYTENNVTQIFSEFRFTQHDRQAKQLSYRFENTIIKNEYEEEYKTLVDVLLDAESTATFICKKLYRYFVFYDVTEEVETQLIFPLAKLMKDNNYEIKPVLKALLTSANFFEECVIGSMIRNPLDFILNTVVTLPTKLGTDTLQVYKSQASFVDLSSDLQMELYNHPDVAGWKAYYQAPNYYKLWINSGTLPIRAKITDELLAGDEQLLTGVNILKFIDGLPNPYDLNVLILDIVKLIFPKSISDRQLQALKNIVIPGLPDFEWTVEYTMYRDEPENFPILWSVRIKMKNLLITMLRMPEYYLS